MLEERMLRLRTFYGGVAMTEFGKKLRQWRKARHFTQAEVAERIHCDRSYLSRIENGDVSPSIELLQTLCDVLGVSLEILLDAAPRTGGDLIVRRCLSLLEQGRVSEAQTLAAASWWDYLDGSSDIADRLMAILVATPNDHPEVLSIILAQMFRQATSGNIDDAFFRHGFYLQRSLAEHGQLRASWIFCQSLLALSPGPSDAFVLTLSLGTTLFRLRDLHLAGAMYARARKLRGLPETQVNLGRVFHGLGACELDLEHPLEAIRLTQRACKLYEDSAPDLYHLALQNLAMAYHFIQEEHRAVSYLERCGRYWSDSANASRVHEIESLLERLR